MTPPRPTAAQLAALRLAAIEPIRYYKGGWYSIPEHCGDDQRAIVSGRGFDVIGPGTLRACVARGWLAVSSVNERDPSEIYGLRWTITVAGRAALSAAGGDK